MRIFATLAFLLVIATLSSCIEETRLRGLPPLTTNGENTIGCIVNGATIYNEYTSNAEAIWHKEDEVLGMTLAFNDGSELDLTLHIPLPDRALRDFVIDSTYQLSGNVPIQREATYFRKGPVCLYYVGGASESPVENTLSIKFSRLDISGDSGVVSGTFEGIMKNKDCADLTITDGRFDIMIGPKPRLGPW